MADEIVGVAVLDTAGPIQWLYYARTVDGLGGEVSCDELPVMPDGGMPPSVPLPSWFPENRPWKYRIEGDALQVHPSVHIKGFFHNHGQWVVKFQVATGKTRQDHYRQLALANPGLAIANIERRLDPE